eukprot:gene39880-48564_t
MDCPICFSVYNYGSKQPIRTFCVCSQTLCADCLQNILASSSCCPWDKTRWVGRHVMRKFQASTPANYLAVLRRSVVPNLETIISPSQDADIACILEMDDVDVLQQARLLAECERRVRDSSPCSSVRPDRASSADDSGPGASSSSPAAKKSRSIADYFVGQSGSSIENRASYASESSSNRGVLSDDPECASSSGGEMNVPAVFPLWRTGSRGKLATVKPIVASTASRGRRTAAKPLSLGKDGKVRTGACSQATRPGEHASGLLFRPVTESSAMASGGPTNSWACARCSFLNHSWLPYCELCEALKPGPGDKVP